MDLSGVSAWTGYPRADNNADNPYAAYHYWDSHYCSASATGKGHGWTHVTSNIHHRKTFNTETLWILRQIKKHVKTRDQKYHPQFRSLPAERELANVA
jgi:hypothetical protein